MSNFQILTIIFLSLFAIDQIIKLLGQPILKIVYGIRWLVLTIISAIIIIFPEISTKISSFLGIGRGSDLVLYVSLLWLLHKSYSDSRSIKELSEKVDHLTRSIALNNEKIPRKR